MQVDDRNVNMEEIEDHMSKLAFVVAMRERCARVCEKRAEKRFEECGTRESDTGATYYGGRDGAELAARDEEDDDCAKAIRALPVLEDKKD